MNENPLHEYLLSWVFAVDFISYGTFIFILYHIKTSCQVADHELSEFHQYSPYLVKILIYTQ